MHVSVGKLFINSSDFKYASSPCYSPTCICIFSLALVVLIRSDLHQYRAYIIFLTLDHISCFPSFSGCITPSSVSHSHSLSCENTIYSSIYRSHSYSCSHAINNQAAYVVYYTAGCICRTVVSIAWASHAGYGANSQIVCRFVCPACWSWRGESGSS